MSFLTKLFLIFYILGPLRVDSPLYFVYRSPEQKRKVINLPNVNEIKDAIRPQQKEVGPSEVKNVSENPLKTLKEGETPISSTAVDINITLKEAAPREIIQARSAFDTIKDYCNTLIRNSSKSSNSALKNENRKSMNLNFFAKPIVDRPISIP